MPTTGIISALPDEIGGAIVSFDGFAFVAATEGNGKGVCSALG
jgi:hypothetical protein